MKRLIVSLLVLIGVVFGATAVQMDFLMSGVMDNSGKPLNGGKVYFYVNNGGTTTKPIYTSAAMSSVLAQPVVLNASGVPTSIPYGSGTYRVVWKTAAGVTVKTVTDVQYGTDIDSGVAVVDVGLTYGYNNAAVASAIAYAGANPTTLYFSAGEYTIGTSKTFPTNVQVQFAKGGYWTVADGIVVSLNSAILAPQNEHIFRLGGTGTGVVDISTANNPIILGKWKNNTGVVDIQNVLNTTTLNVASNVIINGVTVNPFFTGNGSDGIKYINTSMILSGSAQYTNFELGASGVISIDRYLTLYVNDTCTISGKIIGDGDLYGTSSGLGGGRGGIYPAGDVVGNNGEDARLFGATGGGGGSSSTGKTGGYGGNSFLGSVSGGAGGSGTNVSGATGNSLTTSNAMFFLLNGIPGYGSGGGSGGSAGLTAGYGGSGGAQLILIAKKIVFSGSPVISCKGENGPPAFTVSGGGAGGGGGIVYIKYHTLVGSVPTIDVSGGTGGSATAAVGKGGNGGNGFSLVEQR